MFCDWFCERNGTSQLHFRAPVLLGKHVPTDEDRQAIRQIGPNQPPLIELISVGFLYEEPLWRQNIGRSIGKGRDRQNSLIRLSIGRFQKYLWRLSKWIGELVLTICWCLHFPLFIQWIKTGLGFFTDVGRFFCVHFASFICFLFLFSFIYKFASLFTSGIFVVSFEAIRERMFFVTILTKVVRYLLH